MQQSGPGPCSFRFSLQIPNDTTRVKENNSKLRKY